VIEARVGDPILSADGDIVVAKWKVGLGMQEGTGFAVAVTPDLATAHRLADITDPAVRYREQPRILLDHVVTFPDRAYWRLVRDVPLDWLRVRNRYFTHPDAEVDPSNPRGMIAAIDELVTRHHPERYGTGDWLAMIRSYYQTLADRHQVQRTGAPNGN
jgi:hypothetical protein